MWKRTRGSDTEGDESSISKQLKDLGIPDANSLTPRSNSEACDNKQFELSMELAQVVTTQTTVFQTSSQQSASTVQSDIATITATPSIGTGYTDE